MDEVIPGLFVGSQDSADAVLLRDEHVGAVLSVGCLPVVPLPEEVKHNAEFSQIMDKPEERIISIFTITDEFIKTNLSEGKILVHCVYGQSRSCSVAVSYLMNVLNIPLRSAIQMVREARPTICINPGFLCQLHVMSLRDACLPTYSLLMGPAKHGHWSHSLSEPRATRGAIKCLNRSCRHILASSGDVVMPIDYTSLMKEELDSFWNGYFPLHDTKAWTSIDRSKHEDWIPLGPLPWILEKLSIPTAGDVVSPSPAKRARVAGVGNDGTSPKEEGELQCPGCGNVCGFWRERGLAVCNDFILVHLFALNKSAVVLPKNQK